MSLLYLVDGWLHIVPPAQTGGRAEDTVFPAGGDAPYCDRPACAVGCGERRVGTRVAKYRLVYWLSGFVGNVLLGVGAFSTHLLLCWCGRQRASNTSVVCVIQEAVAADVGLIEFLGSCPEGQFYESRGCRACAKYSAFEAYFCVDQSHGARMAPAHTQMVL